MDPQLVVAVSGFVGTVGTIALKFRALDRKISTNRGKTPGEYIEMNGEMRDMIAVIDDRTKRIERKVDSHGERIAVLEARL